MPHADAPQPSARPHEPRAHEPRAHEYQPHEPRPHEYQPSVDLRPGVELPVRTYRVTRADLVRYAGASGDFNPIHWSDRVATSVGLPGVIAHGMYTMALAGRALVEWAGDPGAVVDYAVRFTRPVVVPDDDTGVEVTVAGSVREPTEHPHTDAGHDAPAERPPSAHDAPAEYDPPAGDRFVRIDLSVSCRGEKVLGQARAVVRVRQGNPPIPPADPSPENRS